MKPWTMLASLLLAPAVAASAATLPSRTLGLAPATHVDATLPALDRAKVLAEDARRTTKAGPLRYAVASPVGADVADGGKSAQRWSRLADGREMWRFTLSAPGALGVEVGFADLFLPQGAELYVAARDGTLVHGPYTDADNTRSGVFWAPLVPGDGALVELVVPADMRKHVRLELARAASAYRGIDEIVAGGKSLACNIDVACPQADTFRDQVRGIAGYGFGNNDNRILCTGQLLNNTRSDRARLFLTADHCTVNSQAVADTVTVYWRYESPTCRAPGSAASGTPISLATAIAQPGGATLRATFGGSDFTLLELRTPVPAAAQAFFLGWDRRDTVPATSAIIHHSAGDEKRISLVATPGEVNTQPIVIGGGIFYDANASLEVTYSESTTEGGASGGALIDQNRRVVGQLGGGPDGTCSFQITDTYGRLFTSWTGGGTPASRLSDWLDPAGTGAQFVDGVSQCTPATIALDGPATGFAGQAATFTAVATGTGPFTFAWDVDNDGTIDRTQSNLTSSASISPSFATATSTNVVVRVTDATGCTGQAQRAINVSAPDIVATAQTAQQVCGDGDAAIEPGERWRVPVRLFNAGGKALDGAHAVFAPTAPASGGSDAFAHQVIDSSNPGCRAQFVDIGDATPLPLIASGAGIGAEDDGRTAPIALGAGAFSFYGQPVTQVVMSTNGYLSTAAGESGGDFDNTCALAPPDRGSTGGRINVQHDDLVVQTGGGLRTRFFATCPRPPDSGTAPAACTVFQWNNMGQFGTGGANGNAVFQAIVYAGTNEIVYQYQTALPGSGASTTIGIQNAAATDRLQYACEAAGSAPAGRAVCLFESASLPPSLVGARLRVETPAPAVNNLGSGQEQVVNLDFRVDDTATCGSPVNLRYVGTVDNVAYSVRSGAVLTATLGAGGACNASQCPASPAPIAARDGFFANPSRFGNGIGAFNIGTTWFGLWFTGERNRLPTWLALQGDRIGDQVVAPILRFRRTSDSPWAVTSSVVGEAQVSYVGPDEYVLTWVLDGVPGGEQQNSLYPRVPAPNPNRTGAWFFPAESGWGTAYDDHLLGGNFDQVGINYLYGGDGTARWTLGATSSPNSGEIAQATFLVHCPTCPNFADFINFPLAAGSVSRNFTSQTLGTQTMGVVFPAPLSGTFTRTAVPFQMLTTPQPQGQ